MTFTYVYYVDGFAKVGHTADLDTRLSQLVWDRPPGVTANAGGGGYIATYLLPSKRDAMLTEQLCQDILQPFVVDDRSKRRGGRCEWFKVSAEKAAAALGQAAAGETITFELTDSEMKVFMRYKRQIGASSIAQAVRTAVWEGFKELRAHEHQKGRT